MSTIANLEFRTPSAPSATHGDVIKTLAEREHLQRPLVESSVFPFRPSPSYAGTAPRAVDAHVERRVRGGLPLGQLGHDWDECAPGLLPPPPMPNGAASMGSHHRRRRYCGDCLSGDHDLNSDTWRTDFLRLVRLHCACEACDCTFRRVHVEEPRFDQRHQQPVVSPETAN